MKKKEGGGKLVNRVVITYTEDGPDEYAVQVVSDYDVTSKILITVRSRTAVMEIGENKATLNMAPLPTYDNTSISPTEDDYYIYEVIIE